ncbi:MAG: type II secretion system F family protein [Candidatus Eremiobacteraeota bacterium]|nr:type II secretion system F family protein [Candidatus Eremiobacteraeota bacterium]
MVTAAPLAIAAGVVVTFGLIAASYWQRIAGRIAPLFDSYRFALQRADVHVSSEQVLAAVLSVAGLLWFIVVSLFRLDPLRGALVFPLALGAASGIAWQWIRHKQRARLSAFDDQLEIVLRLMTSGLRAGLGLRQALVLVVDELGDPAKTEFQRVLGQTAIGVSPYDALDAMAKRMPSEECTMMARAIRVQSQSGGNLGKVLEHLAVTITERRRVLRKMRSLTAEGRLTALIIVALPLAVGGFVSLMQPSIGLALIGTMIGRIALGIVFVLETAGWLVLRAIMNFDV